MPRIEFFTVFPPRYCLIGNGEFVWPSESQGKAIVALSKSCLQTNSSFNLRRSLAAAEKLIIRASVSCYKLSKAS